MATDSQGMNRVFSSLSAKRRYEVWFVRMGLSDGGGAWWFRYLLLNPGRASGAQEPNRAPVQVWATWFPREGTPQSFIQGLAMETLDLSTRGGVPFHFQTGANRIEDGRCSGDLRVEGHTISWDLQYSSTFAVTLSDKSWIGFSRTPHSDAVFSGRVMFDGKTFEGNPLGFGLQGHNCGYRHRNYWTWAHAIFSSQPGHISTFEALIYEMPLGMFFRKAVLWHEGNKYPVRAVHEVRRDRSGMYWTLAGRATDGSEMVVDFDGSGPHTHRLPYFKTDRSGRFEVANNSLANAKLVLRRKDKSIQKMDTAGGAVLEMVGG
jgi:hypothetical protein